MSSPGEREREGVNEEVNEGDKEAGRKVKKETIWRNQDAGEKRILKNDKMK